MIYGERKCSDRQISTLIAADHPNGIYVPYDPNLGPEELRILPRLCRNCYSTDPSPKQMILEGILSRRSRGWAIMGLQVSDMDSNLLAGTP